MDENEQNERVQHILEDGLEEQIGPGPGEDGDEEVLEEETELQMGWQTEDTESIQLRIELEDAEYEVTNLQFENEKLVSDKINLQAEVVRLQTQLKELQLRVYSKSSNYYKIPQNCLYCFCFTR